MRTRRKAREAALQALYQCDTLGEWSPTCVALYFDSFCNPSSDEDEEVSKENLEFSQSLVSNIIEKFETIDALISAASTRWSISRMARVDRNILRLATCELAFHNDIPMNVSINEAIEIAKRFGTDDSPMFINGVLDNIAHSLSNDPQYVQSLGIEEKVAV